VEGDIDGQEIPTNPHYRPKSEHEKDWGKRISEAATQEDSPGRAAIKAKARARASHTSTLRRQHHLSWAHLLTSTLSQGTSGRLRVPSAFRRA
jgi:hypothetical protein